ncbi:MAG: hypothetical protein ABIF71_11990 [Planctomycetota bacterium]
MRIAVFADGPVGARTIAHLLEHYPGCHFTEGGARYEVRVTITHVKDER